MAKARCREVCARIIRVHRRVSRAVSLATVLRVVEGVERLPLELDASPFGDSKSLKGAEVEVQTAWQVDDIAPYVAESKARRKRKCLGIENQRSPLGRDIGIGDGVRIANQVGTGPSANSVTNAGVVSKGCTVRHAIRCAGLCDGDTRNLPSAQERVQMSRRLEEGQRVNVADRGAVSLIEVRRCAIRGDVVGVHECSVEGLRRIIDRVTVGVSKTECQSTDSTLSRNLQSVVGGVCLVLQDRKVAHAGEVRAKRVRVVSARHLEIWYSRRRNCRSVAERRRNRDAERVLHKVVAVCATGIDWRSGWELIVGR